MNRLMFLIQVASLTVYSMAVGNVRAQAARTNNPPNIIFILTDDQGWTSVSYR